MAEKEEPKTDWIYLPPEVEEVSLWGCLHDGELVSCRSDRKECEVYLEFYVQHLLEENEKDLRFLMTVDGVTSVRASTYLLPNGRFIEPQNVSAEQREKLSAEYYSKWREESFSWTEFELALPTDSLQISDASFVSKGSESTLRFSGHLNGERFNDIYCDVFVRGRSLSVSRSDGKGFSMGVFIDLGREYWESL